MAGAGLHIARSSRPHLLVLLSDDQRWDMLGCLGNPFIETPQLDALARRGVLFRQAFVTTSLCPTSRASILTGLSARRHGVADSPNRRSSRGPISAPI